MQKKATVQLNIIQSVGLPHCLTLHHAGGEVVGMKEMQLCKPYTKLKKHHDQMPYVSYTTQITLIKNDILKQRGEYT